MQHRDSAKMQIANTQKQVVNAPVGAKTQQRKNAKSGKF
jgi:hypothetical protein